MKEEYYKEIKKVLYSFLFTIVVIIFLELLYKASWIQEILVILENSILPEATTIVFIVFSILFILNKDFSIIFRKTYHYLIQLFLVYLYYRIYSDYQFLKIFNQGYFIDVIFIAIVITVIILIVKSFNSTENNLNKKSGFIYEKPLSNKDKEDILEKDSLKRAPFVKKLVNKVNNTELRDGSFGIGIIGKWGTGKTSFMELMKHEIKKSNSNSIIIEFNPWQSENADRITEAFFDLLSYELGKSTISVSRLINAYLSKLSGKENLYTGLINLFTFNRSSEKLYEEIEDTLVRLNKTIFIFIDDLDRLDENEIKSVFKLIRNTANFKNTVFIVGYDNEYIQTEFGGANANEYLKKIFNIQIPLPFINEDSLNKHINVQSAKKNFEFENIKHLLANEEDVLGKELKNIRDLNLISNSFDLLREIIGEEVSKKDLIILEILRLNYPILYEALIKNKDEIIHEDNGIYKLNQTFKEPFKKFQGNKLLEILFSQIGQSKTGVPSLNINHTLSICDVKYFERFFILRLLENEISKPDFEKIMESEFSEIQKSLDFWIKNKKDDLFAKILSREKKSFQSKRIFKNYLQSSFYIICWNWSKNDVVSEQKQMIEYIIRLALYDKENLSKSHKYYEKIDEHEFRSDFNELYDEYYPKMNTKVRIHFQFALIEFIRSVSGSQNIGLGIRINSVLQAIIDVTKYSEGSEVNSQLSLLRDLSEVISVIERFEEDSQEIINKLKPQLRANIEKIPIDKLYESINKSNHLHYGWLTFFSFYFGVDKDSIQNHLDEKSGAFTQRAISKIIKSPNEP